LSVDGESLLSHPLPLYTRLNAASRACDAAFLLNNGKQYHTAHIIGLTEYFITCYFINDTSASVIPANILALRKWWMSYGSLVIGTSSSLLFLSSFELNQP
jgi:hypothetical protein